MFINVDLDSIKRTRLNASCAEAADSTLHPEERKRLLHLNAEKNRREALKDGFERECLDKRPFQLRTTFAGLISTIDNVCVEDAGVKVTNAVVLNRAAKHIRDLQKRVDSFERDISECEQRNTALQKRVA